MDHHNLTCIYICTPKTLQFTGQSEQFLSILQTRMNNALSGSVFYKKKTKRKSSQACDSDFYIEMKLEWILSMEDKEL